MNWSFMVVAMLPEHLLLIGIVVLIMLDVLDVGEKHAATVATGAVLLSTLIAVFLAIAVPGFAVPDFSVDQPTMVAKAVVLALAADPAAVARQFSATSASTSCCCRRCTQVLLVSSSDGFLTMFLGLEIMSMPVTRWCCSRTSVTGGRGGTEVPGAGGAARRCS
jgi:NADH:ubiquinone oxidoreductase subunit 2 (subunit N)